MILIHYCSILFCGLMDKLNATCTVVPWNTDCLFSWTSWSSGFKTLRFLKIFKHGNAWGFHNKYRLRPHGVTWGSTWNWWIHLRAGHVLLFLVWNLTDPCCCWGKTFGRLSAKFMVRRLRITVTLSHTIYSFMASWCLVMLHESSHNYLPLPSAPWVAPTNKINTFHRNGAIVSQSWAKPESTAWVPFRYTKRSKKCSKHVPARAPALWRMNVFQAA